MNSVSNLAIDIQGLHKRFRLSRLRRSYIHAINGIDLQVKRGEIYGLLGPNGAGKTTLIKILLGIVRPDSGYANVFDKPAGDAATRSRIGYMPDHLHVPRHHTGLTALYFLGRLSRMSEAQIKQRIPTVLEMVDLRGREKELVRNYSKGMRQRLGLAQALLHEPDIVLLDEPTDGLDPIGRHDMRVSIQRLRDQGKTIFVNSHLLHEVEVLCDRFTILTKGVVVGSGTKDEMLHALGGKKPAAATFEVIGKRDSIDSALLHSGVSVESLEQVPSSLREFAHSDVSAASYLIKLATIDPNITNRLIDSLRSHSICVVNMRSQLPNLEEIFLELVRQTDPIVEPTNVVDQAAA